MVVAVDADVLQYALVVQIDNRRIRFALRTGKRGFQFSDASTQRAGLVAVGLKPDCGVRRGRARGRRADASGSIVISAAMLANTGRGVSSGTGRVSTSSGSQSCHPAGGAGHLGSGRQSSGGVQLAGGCGQPGGALNRTATTAPVPARPRWCLRVPGRTVTWTLLRRDA